MAGRAKGKGKGVGTGLAETCRRHLADWRAARRRILRSGPDRSAVHAWRISTRRLLAMEALLAPAATDEDASPIQALVRKSFRASGRLRDAQQVQRAMRELAGKQPEAARVARFEKRRLPRLRKRLLRHLKRVPARAPADAASAWLPQGVYRPNQLLVTRARRRLSMRLRALSRPLPSTADARELHAYRMLLKQARYMSELLQDAGLEVTAESTRTRMSELQTRLGAITDLDQALRAVRRVATQEPAWRTAADALRKALDRRRRQLTREIPQLQ